MKPLDALSAEEARGLLGVVFDLDDTLLDHGALTEAAYAALFRLREAGLRLIACTGRPAGWGEVLQRQWPIDASITENGAVALVRGAHGEIIEVRGTPEAPGTSGVPEAGGRGHRRAHRVELVRLAEELIKLFPAAALADDNDLRATDVTIDIGEHRRVPPEEIAAMRDIAMARGVRTLQSSVHLHLTRETADKASGTVRVLSERFNEDATRARLRYAFVGDSGNDAACFSAFAVTFGVANVRAHLGRLSVPPRYVADAPMGAGFAAIAARIVALR